MKRRPQRRYTAEDIALMKKLRAEDVPWAQIARRLGVNRSAAMKALSHHEGLKGAMVFDKMPSATRSWPAGVDFTPDELQVRT